MPDQCNGIKVHYLMSEINQIKVMQQQQKKRSKISQIIDKKPSITLEQLIYQYYDEKLPTQDISKQLVQIEQEQNGLDDRDYDLKLVGQRMGALNGDLILDVIHRFDELNNIKSQPDPQNENQFIVQNDNKQTYSQQDFHVEQERFRQETSSKFQTQIARQTQKNQTNVQNPHSQFKQSRKSQLNSKPQYQLKAVNNNANFEKADAEFSTNLPKVASSKKSKKSQRKPSKQQESKHWKSKEPSKQINHFFDNLNENQFEQEPQVMPNFQNQQEVLKLSDDQRNHKNLFDERVFELVDQQVELKRSNSFYSKKYIALKNNLNRYLIAAYYQYVLEANSTEAIFDKDQIFKKPYMDLTLFLKFYKDLELKEFLKVADVTKIFKKQAFNHLWLDTSKFMEICYKVIETKSGQNGKQPTYVNTQEEILDRGNKLMKQFNKERMKKCLKIPNKEIWNKIIEDYKNRNVQPTVEKKHQNKGEVVGKFLERNFDLELPKWYEKKDLNANPHVVKSRVKQISKQKQGKKSRDQKTISTNIQKLRSQSQKSIKVLKSLFDQKFDEQLRSLIADRSQGRKSQQFTLGSPKNIVNKAPLHKNKHKNTISAYKEIEKFINENMKSIKAQKTLLGKDLRINEDEPFLNAYFSRQMKMNAPKNSGRNEVMADAKLANKKSNLSSGRGGKTDKLPQMKGSPPIKKFSIEDGSKANKKSKDRNEFMSLEKLDKIRKEYSNSSPSYPAQKEVEPRRVYSMKKIVENSKIQHKLSPSQKSIVSKSSIKKIVGGQAKLNQAQADLINKKLYDFLLNNKEQQKSLLEIQKNSKKKNGEASQSLKTEGQENHLMQNYRQEVYELFKNFVKREKQEQQIVAYENQKRRGYLKAQKNPEVFSPKK